MVVVMTHEQSLVGRSAAVSNAVPAAGYKRRTISIPPLRPRAPASSRPEQPQPSIMANIATAATEDILQSSVAYSHSDHPNKFPQNLKHQVATSSSSAVLRTLQSSSSSTTTPESLPKKARASEESSLVTATSLSSRRSVKGPRKIDNCSTNISHGPLSKDLLSNDHKSQPSTVHTDLRDAIQQRPGTPHSRKRLPTVVVSTSSMATSRSITALAHSTPMIAACYPTEVQSNSYCCYIPEAVTQSSNPPLHRHSDANQQSEAIRTAAPPATSSSRTMFLAIHKEFSKALAHRKQLRAVHLELQQRPVSTYSLSSAIRDQPMLGTTRWHNNNHTTARMEVTAGGKSTSTDDTNTPDNSSWCMDEADWQQELETAWAQEIAAVRPTTRKGKSPRHTHGLKQPRKQTSHRISNNTVVADSQPDQIISEDDASLPLSILQSPPTRGQRNISKDCPKFDSSILVEPRAPPDAFCLFSQEQRPIVEANHPDFSRVAILSAIRDMWHNLPSSEKQDYIDQEAAAQSEYRQNMKAWKGYQRELEKPLASAVGRKRNADRSRSPIASEPKNPPAHASPHFRNGLQPVHAKQTNKTELHQEKEPLQEGVEHMRAQKRQRKNREENSNQIDHNSGRSNKSYSFILREPLTRQADGTFPQPRGRKPAGHSWDGFVGTWVPDDNNDNNPFSETNDRSKSVPAKVLTYGRRKRARLSSSAAWTLDSLFGLTSAEESPNQRQSTPRQFACARNLQRYSQRSASKTESRPSSSFSSVIGRQFSNRTVAKSVQKDSKARSQADGRHNDVDSLFGHFGSYADANPPKTVEPTAMMGPASLTRKIDNVRVTIADRAVKGAFTVQSKKFAKAKSTPTKVTQTAQRKSTLVVEKEKDGTMKTQHAFTAEGDLIPNKSPVRRNDGTFARPVGRSKSGFTWNRIRGMWQHLGPPTVHQLKTDVSLKNTPVNEPRYIPCRCCVGCKMSTNCDSCLQCLLRTDASPETQSHFVCMQRICSAPRMNPVVTVKQNIPSHY